MNSEQKIRCLMPRAQSYSMNDNAGVLDAARVVVERPIAAENQSLTAGRKAKNSDEKKPR